MAHDRDREPRFRFDTALFRDRALLDMLDGAVTSAHAADVAAVQTLLDQLTATSALDLLRFEQHAATAAGAGRAEVYEVLRTAAEAERDALRLLARRCLELGGVLDLDPETVARRSVTTYRAYAMTEHIGLLRENLLAKRLMIQVYLEAVRWLGDGDPTSRRVVEQLLESAEHTATALATVLQRYEESRPY
ncbi:ferritin-like domain-containing protein [Kibdelosporangium aridum]|uniref:Bacterioferritin n=1 Tax=Kibdelosporangium aridum TaxID=2030 RepID=A0A1W2FXS3_KIBAR|nr:ferritin-like domain-containing protein [Kibdelosporangium aridum]SMD26418.1 bacterioferritin [Kibdelosporangium aridum]